MIIRRLSNSLRKQDWATVLIEILIVVVGVFIGIEVSNWNADRQDRQLENSYIDRLYVDMEKSLDDRRSDAQWDAERLRTQNIVLSALRSGELASQDRIDFDTGLLLFGSMNEPRARWTTVDELRSSGGTTLIRDVALRDAIGGMQSQISRRNALSQALTGSINSLREQIANRYEIVDFDFQSERAATLSYDFSALVDDTEFLNLLSQIDYYARTKSSNSDNLAAAVDKFRLELELRRNTESERQE